MVKSQFYRTDNGTEWATIGVNLFPPIPVTNGSLKKYQNVYGGLEEIKILHSN